MRHLVFSDAVKLLRKQHGRQEPPPARGAFELALWEACAYLVNDEARLRTFRALEAQVGLAPAAIMAAGPGKVAAAIREGGMSPPMRAEKLLRAAELALEIGPEELQEAVEKRPAEGLKLVARFPNIGKPGAEKLLMMQGSLRTVAPESNGVRVLTRLGFAVERKDYAATYRDLAKALESELPRRGEDLTQAHLLLRTHGQTICRRSAPGCERCVLAERCAFARQSG